jgi:hypothetical protein
MAQLRFPVSSAGLIVPVWLGLCGRETAYLVAAGQAVPRPVHGHGMLDTGSDISAVSSTLLRQLGIGPATATSTTTAAGPIAVRLFEVSVSITDPNQSPTAWLTEPDLLVMELPAVLPAIDVLIGLDVLLKIKLDLDGPAKYFTLTF